jgi:hypothetical protein
MAMLWRLCLGSIRGRSQLQGQKSRVVGLTPSTSQNNLGHVNCIIGAEGLQRVGATLEQYRASLA